MKLSIANSARARYISSIMEYLTAQGEDVALVTSNSCNLPIVEDGEEGVLEVVVKVVKKDYDECMQEREDYKAKCAEAIAKKFSVMKFRGRALCEKNNFQKTLDKIEILCYTIITKGKEFSKCTASISNLPENIIMLSLVTVTVSAKKQQNVLSTFFLKTKLNLSLKNLFV